jgi:predicted SprT family Zn-dependent metalloprotease
MASIRPVHPMPEPAPEHKQVLIEKIRVCTRRWARRWKTPRVTDVEIEFSGRLRTSLGRCYPQRALVRLNEVLLLSENEDLLIEVACHEVAHVAVFERYGEQCRPHGPEWSVLVQAAGFQPTLRAAAAGPEPARRTSSKSNVLYQHRCKSCGAMRTVRRPMVHWRCAKCVAAGRSGELQIISLSAAEKAKT